MDDADRAQLEQDSMERWTRAQKKPEAPKPVGRCLNCNSRIAKDERFCDKDCRDDWQYRQGRLK